MDSSPPVVNVYPDLEETGMTTDQLKVSFDNIIQMMQDKLLSKKASNANSGDNSDDDEGSDNDFTKEQYVSNNTMQLSDLDQTLDAHTLYQKIVDIESALFDYKRRVALENTKLTRAESKSLKQDEKILRRLKNLALHKMQEQRRISLPDNNKE